MLKSKLRALGMLALLTTGGCSWAFDASKVPEGLYYNGTHVNGQLWTPLVLSEQGNLVDPFLRAQQKGLSSLEGKGKTDFLRANTAFLYGVCRTHAKLGSTDSVLGKVATVSVLTFEGDDCPRENSVLQANFLAPRAERADVSTPTLVFTSDGSKRPTFWIYGVPGMLAGKYLEVSGRTEQELGGRPEEVAGAVSRIDFLPLPIVEVDFKEVAFKEHRPKPRYTVTLDEAVHRGSTLTVTSERWREVRDFIKAQLWPRFFPKLEAALGTRFGGVDRSYFELGLMQGIDIDNTRAFDYAGVARIGVETKAGPWRWVDVIWCWRYGLGTKPEALQILRTSEPELYATENRYFSEKNPSLWSPNLLISAFADFDKDKRMEVVSSLVRPVGIGEDRRSTSTGGIELWLRDSAIHAWTPGGSLAGQWSEIYRTALHEARRLHLNPEDIDIRFFGEETNDIQIGRP